MGCCILGVLIFAAIYRVWRRCGVALGFRFKSDAENPVLWRYGNAVDENLADDRVEVVGAFSPQKNRGSLPLVAPRLMIIVGFVLILAVGVPTLTHHAGHIKTEIACMVIKLELPIDSAWETCFGDGICRGKGDRGLLL